MNSLLPYSLYILQCNDGTYYTGITSELVRRINEHNTSTKGAKYTRNRRPVVLVYHETYPDKSSALKREVQIKRLTRAQKIDLIASTTPYNL
ncbi:MAG: GIY-YIG nuclease family protein [Sulfuricurvum sp.]|uniref:GIY-YIG nuclease family protein n=1 Tax=Sulfuricurvum sp. TaxID=2025608 RepID=UPI0026226314|nr:GIY-YIG nuclease family protein [Sulfuricurvum sp.]MDD2829142.1 GIY-YIG nuclease family protein [Sulfuricurvum sp.]MDD4950191.1 GIY-YIG nuclease family protein [Sulfuricurvum sp.]